MAEFEAIGKALQIPQSVLNNIDKIDQKINLIASDSEKMATHFMSAMTRMGGGAEGLLTKLNAIQNVIGKLDLSKFAQSVTTVGQGTTQVEQFAAAIAKAAAAINKYNAENRKRTDVDNSKQIAQLNKEIEAMRKRTQQLEEYINKQRQANQGGGRRGGGSSSSGTNSDTKALNAYNRAMAASEALVTQRINKIAKLRNAEEQLRNASGNYATQLNRINQEIARLNRLNEGQVDSYGRVIRSQRNLMNTSQQLARQLALVFSVSAIQGYINKLIEVRGEFELQQTALASILQSKEDADALFGQITELAVRSPFTIKELTTYTKSLAAYQVEYEDLYGTLKMLADVSSGLGVDMQRLILAFGQVKAANFLRGTETRQFTEAGINMLGELAKYYSELEGRIVSVTEVQDRQFKRMISFQDVEEVFKRLTSAGGMFYNMQEKQAETLRGQMMNLQDQIDLMLNDIGKSNQGTITAVISLIKSIIENWRTVVQIMEPIATVLAGYVLLTNNWVGAINVIPRIWQTISRNIGIAAATITRAEAAQRKFNLATRAIAWTTVFGIAATVIWEVVNAIRAAKREQDELNSVYNSGVADAMQLSRNYERLANTVTDATASHKEQKEALEELKRTYAEILPQQYLELDYIRQMKGHYDEATAAIYNFVNAKTKEKQLTIISENEGATLEEDFSDLAKFVQGYINGMGDFNVSMNEARQIVALFRKELESGTIKTTQDAISSLEKFSRQLLNVNSIKFTGFFNRGAILTVLEDFEKYRNAIDGINNADISISTDRITSRLQGMREQIEADLAQVAELLNTIQEYASGNGLVNKQQADAARLELLKYAQSWGVATSAVQKFQGGMVETMELMGQFKNSAYGNFINQIASMRLPTTELGSARMFLQQMRTELAGNQETQFQKYVNGFIKDAARLNGINLDKFVNAFAKADESTEEYAKRIKGQIDNLAHTIALYQKNVFNVPEWSMQSDMGKQSFSNAQKQLTVLQSLYSTIALQSDDGGGKALKERDNALNNELKKLKERIALIKESGDLYKELLKYYSQEKAHEIVVDQFSSRYKELGLSIKGVSFTLDGMIKKISGLKNAAGEEGVKEIQDTLRELRRQQIIEVGEKGLDEIQEKIDKMFSDYNFNIELESNGIQTSMIRDMMGGLGATEIELGEIGLGASSLEDLQEQAHEKIRELYKMGGDEAIKMANDIQEKLTDIEVREARKRIDELLTLREKYTTREAKITRLGDEIYQWQAELVGLEAFQDEYHKMMAETLRLKIKQNQDLILELRSEALQLTDFWRTLFGDLNDVSFRALQDLIRMNNEVISNASPIRDESGQVKGYNSAFKDRNGNEVAVQMTVGQYNQLIKAKKQLDDEMSDRNPILAFWNTLKRGPQEGQKSVDYLKELANEADNLATAFLNVAEQAVDVFGDDYAQQKMQGVQDMFSGVKSSIQGIASGNPLALASGILSIASGIRQIHDSKIEEQIQRQMDLIDSLERRLEKLYEAMQNALNPQDLLDSKEDVLKNIDKRIASYQEAINLERSKKSVDQNKIKEYNNAIEDLLKEREDAEKDFIESLGGFGDDESIKSAAEEFVDAWLTAFSETGSGLDALNEKMEDVLRNVMIKQMTLAVADRFIKPLLDGLNKQLEDANWSPEEQEEFWNNWEETMPQLDEFLTSLAERFPELTKRLKESENELSGLSKGIQGITEDQADILAAITESIRYYSADSNAILRSFYQQFTAPAADNPFMQQMRMQSEYLRIMSDLMRKMTRSVAGSGVAMQVKII